MQLSLQMKRLGWEQKSVVLLYILRKMHQNLLGTPEVSHNCEQSERLLFPVLGQQSVRSIMG